MGRKKPFIKPGEGVKFYLVNRSQKDPLYLDESLGEHVLVPADDNIRQDLVDQVNGLHLAPNRTQSEKEALKNKRLEEQKKFGIYYDDNYNYLQHLKNIDNVDEETAQMDKPDMLKIGNILIKNDIDEDNRLQKLNLPSTVFASGEQFEEKVGYFNQAAPDNDPKIDWDPDVVAVLDEDPDIDFEDVDNFMDDDFFLRANADDGKAPKRGKDLKNKSLNVDEGDSDDEEYEGSDRDFDSDEAENDFFDNFSESQSVKEFETKSRFSEYSMTSSVIKRNEKLRSLDSQFENIYAQYDEDQIGGLDMEEIDGYRDSTDKVLESALDEFDLLMKKTLYVAPANTKVKSKPKLDVLKEEGSEEDDEGEGEETETESDDKTECGSDSEDTDAENDQAKKNYELVKFKTKKDKDDRLDCESILSTYSTIYNHPAMISEKRPAIELSKKTGLPLGVLGDKPITKKQMDKIEHKITRILPEIPNRSKDETKEERKERKQMVKEHRRERRVEKKINKMAFKYEEKIQICQMSNQANQIKLPL